MKELVIIETKREVDFLFLLASSTFDQSNVLCFFFLLMNALKDFFLFVTMLALGSSRSMKENSENIIIDQEKEKES
jgi:hypothetical protein